MLHNGVVFYMVAAFGILIGSLAGFAVGSHYPRIMVISLSCHHPYGTDHNTTFAPDEHRT